MSTGSLVISLVGLVVYVAFILHVQSGRAQMRAFVWVTGLELIVSLVSVGASLLGWPREKRRWLQVLSVAVAVAFVLTMGIMALNILVYGLR